MCDPENMNTAYTQSSYADWTIGIGPLRAKSGDYGGGSETLIAESKNTLYEAYQHHGYRESEVSGTLTADQNTSIRGVSPLIENAEKVLRRLTPEECELLQGFPKGWTDIGEWKDTRGKVHKESSDTARYKALGNSIALPYWKVLAKKISAQYDRDITIGSLFDGIGGFPLAFEHCGGKAVWASEIEEFPIAVTKRRFPEEGGDTVDKAATP